MSFERYSPDKKLKMPKIEQETGQFTILYVKVLQKVWHLQSVLPAICRIKSHVSSVYIVGMCVISITQSVLKHDLSGIADSRNALMYPPLYIQGRWVTGSHRNRASWRDAVVKILDYWTVSSLRHYTIFQRQYCLFACYDSLSFLL